MKMDMNKGGKVVGERYTRSLEALNIRGGRKR